MVSVGCFGVRVSVVFRFVFVRYAFGSVWVAGWLPFGRWLPARLVFCSLCVLSVCGVCLFPALGFGSGVCLLVAPVPVHCFSVTSSSC